MKNKSIVLIMLVLALLSIKNLFVDNDVPEIDREKGSKEGVGELVTQIQTETAFPQEEIIEYETIPYVTEYTENEEEEYGWSGTTTMGVAGVKELTYLITFWDDIIINKKLIGTGITSPITEIIDEGTKIVWREYMTVDVGGIWYWHKMRVWATKYDANCIGCLGRTYSGTEVVKGVCATDPSVIPLGTNFYVVGYGLCRAEDIGGAIKGNDVDLGFVDASKAAWGAEYTDIYLLTSAPDDSSK